jgi:hypothetical protein
MIYFLNYDRVPHLCISTHEVSMGFELSFFFIIIIKQNKIVFANFIAGKFTNIRQSMLKLKTHSGFHDLFRF